MKLEQHEIDGSTWTKVLAYVEDQIEKHKRSLETDRPELETAKLRGQIKALRSVLTLGQLEQPSE
jgi:hypothetical protein